MDDNFKTLHDKLMEISKNLTIKTIESVFNKTIKAKKQIKKNELKKAPKIFKKDTYINWKMDTLKIYNFIRGMSPYPGARTKIKIKKNEFDLIITDVSSYSSLNKSNNDSLYSN